MTRPRRSRRRPAPRGLAEISYCEQSLWVGSGPLLEGDRTVLTDNTLPRALRWSACTPRGHVTKIWLQYGRPSTRSGDRTTPAVFFYEKGTSSE